MNIPESSIRPFEPHGIPTIKDNDARRKVVRQMVAYWRIIQHEMPEHIPRALVAYAYHSGADNASSWSDEEGIYALSFSTPSKSTWVMWFPI